jgi:hypothetical protein
MPSTTVKTLVASVGERQLSGDEAAAQPLKQPSLFFLFSIWQGRSAPFLLPTPHL